MDWLAFFIGVALGFPLCWFTKDNIMVMIRGTESFAAKLEAKARALRAAL
jgi:hypothetical protein